MNVYKGVVLSNFSIGERNNEIGEAIIFENYSDLLVRREVKQVKGKLPFIGMLREVSTVYKDTPRSQPLEISWIKKEEEFNEE